MCFSLCLTVEDKAKWSSKEFQGNISKTCVKKKHLVPVIICLDYNVDVTSVIIWLDDNVIILMLTVIFFVLRQQL
jgi:hypothetical protein